MALVRSPVEVFQQDVRALKVGSTLVYHRGFLSRDRVGSPSLNKIAGIALGLAMNGKVRLTSPLISFKPPKRDEAGVGPEFDPTYAYTLKVLVPINPIDFDHARKTWLESIREE